MMCLCGWMIVWVDDVCVCVHGWMMCVWVDDCVGG